VAAERIVMHVAHDADHLAEAFRTRRIRECKAYRTAKLDHIERADEDGPGEEVADARPRP